MEWVKRVIIGFRVLVVILLLLVLGLGIACEVKYPGLSTGTSKWIGPGRGEGYMWPIHLNLAIGTLGFLATLTSLLGPRYSRLFRYTVAISKFYIGGALSLVILDIFTWSLLTAGFITLGVSFNALDRKCYSWYQEESDKTFYCGLPDSISLLDIFSWILLVLIYILIAIERIRFRHGRRNSRQDDSIALFALEHRGQFQLHLNQEAEKGSSQRLSLPDLGGEINWPFKNDITVQGRRQRYI